MLKFSTLFPVDSDANIDRLIDVAQTWIVGSPHSQLTDEELSRHVGKAEWQHKVGSETLSFIAANTAEYNSAGVRYEKQDSELRWVTDIIGTKLELGFYVSVQVSCDTSNPATYIPEPKKPYIVRQLLDSIGGGEDGELTVKDTPHFLSNSDIELATSLIQGSSGVKLPVVYVSAERGNEPFVDAGKLARWFAGMAHVVVEPNREFSFRLMHEVSHNNAYGGAVGIYWPGGAGKKVLLPSISDYDSFHLEREVSNSLRAGLNAVRTPRYCTWGNLKELNARRRVEKLKSEGSTEIESYIDAFDEELAAKSDELSDANREISRLTAALQAAQSASSVASGDPVLVKGSEKELYPNEYKDMLLLILIKLKSQVPANSRREHLLEDVISANTSTGGVEERASSVKAQMRSYRNMDNDMRRFLEELGFEVTGEGKHYKAVFKGDERYIISLPKTSSDHRAGKNIASEIVNLLF